MMTNVNTDQSYDEMNERQKALVDAVAELQLDGVDYSYGDVREKMEKRGLEPYVESTVYRYWSYFDDVIEERKQVIANERSDFDGTVRTEKGPASYEGPSEGIDGTVQTFDERPVKDVEEDEETFLLALNKDRLFQLIRSEDEELARWVFDQVMERNDD